MKDGVFKFKKAKKEQMNYQQKERFNGYSNGSNGNYIDKPLSVFIRKAVETDSE